MSKDLYNYVFSQIDVKKIVEHYKLEYQYRNSEFWINCPFHNETQPSFSINGEKKMFRCWGCQEQGNIFQFIQKMELLVHSRELSYYDAVIISSEVCGIHVSKNKLKQYVDSYSDDVSDIIGIHEGAETEEQEVFLDTAISKYRRRTHGYFISRGFKKETLEYLEMGFLSGDTKDPMNNRCVFPVRNVKGELIGWTGRTILKDTNTEKWYHAPKKKFKKTFCLYNIDKALPYITEAGEVHVVESVANLMRLLESGRYNVVATLGAGISRHQMDLLLFYANRITFWYDWDRGGFDGIKLALSYISDYDSIYVAITDYGLNEQGKSKDLGDVKNQDVESTKIISSFDFIKYMERRFVASMDANFEKDTKLQLPDGKNVICTNKLKRNSDVPQLLPEDVLFIQYIDSLFGVAKMTLYDSVV